MYEDNVKKNRLVRKTGELVRRQSAVQDSKAQRLTRALLGETKRGRVIGFCARDEEHGHTEEHLGRRGRLFS